MLFFNMKKTLATLLLAGNLVAPALFLGKEPENLNDKNTGYGASGAITENAAPISPAFEYFSEQAVRKIDLSTILSHLKYMWYGFSDNPSKNERHIELEKKFYEDIKKIKGNEFERTKKIYEYIVNIIPDYGLPKGVNHGRATLGQIIDSGTGVCTDKSNALYDALKFSGINSDIINGVVGNNLFHQWVRVYLEFDGENIVLDLDPTWYKKFTPIRPTTEFEKIIIGGDNPSTLNAEEYLKYCEKKTDKEAGEILGKYSLSDYDFLSGLFIKRN